MANGQSSIPIPMLQRTVIDINQGGQPLSKASRMALLGNALRNTADEICRRPLAVRVGEGYVDVLAMPKERGLRARCPFASHRNVGEDAANSVYSSDANIVAANEHVLRIVSLNIPLSADTSRSIRQCRSAMRSFRYMSHSSGLFHA